VSEWGLWGLTDTPEVSWRLAMAWDEWAPKIRDNYYGEPGCGAGCQSQYQNRNSQSNGYFIDHGGDGISKLTYSHIQSGDDGRPLIGIGMLSTHPKYRNDGVAEALMRRLHEDHPGVQIFPGFMTDEGKGFRDHMLQKEPEAKQLVTARRLAMAWEDYKDKIQGGCRSCTDGWEGRYTVPQAGAFLNYVHGNHMGKPAVHVQGIYTHPSDRGDGVAEALMRRLSEDHPGVPINPGYMTPDGQKFHDRMLDKEPTAKELVTAALRHASEALGDCYEAATRYMLDSGHLGDPDSPLRIVHGEVAGQGPMKGKTFGHAWVEFHDPDNKEPMVIDPSNGGDLHLPKSMYYQLGKINELNNFHSYTPEEARNRLIDLQHFGPWDLSVNGEPPPGRVELADDEDEYEDDEWDDDDEH